MGKFGFAKQDDMVKADVEAAVASAPVLPKREEKKTAAEAKATAKTAAKPEGKAKVKSAPIQVRRRKPDRACVNFTLATSLLVNFLFFVIAGFLIITSDGYSEEEHELHLRREEYESAMACNAALSDLYKKLFRKISDLNGHLISGYSQVINYDQIESMRQAYEEFNKAGAICKILANQPIPQKPCVK